MNVRGSTAYLHTDRDQPSGVLATNIIYWLQNYTAVANHPRSFPAALGCCRVRSLPQAEQGSEEKLQHGTKSPRPSAGLLRAEQLCGNRPAQPSSTAGAPHGWERQLESEMAVLHCPSIHPSARSPCAGEACCDFLVVAHRPARFISAGQGEPQPCC